MIQSNVVKLVDTKVCKGCGAEKALGEFDRNSGNRGFRTMCKACRREEYRAARGDAPDGRKKQVVTETGRVCVDCNQEKVWDEFSKDIRGLNQKTANCKSCRNVKARAVYQENPAVRRSGMKNRPDKLMRLYGVTYAQVVLMLHRQHGRCDNRACGKEISLDVKGPVKNRAVIDHCHTTGKVRALLCTPCNTILGTVETKWNTILGLIDYAAKFKEFK